jgi:hypothetical protein
VQVPVSTKLNGGGGAALAGNILIGGLVGIVVDTSTGAGYDHYPNPVSVDLVPLKPVPAPPLQPTAPRSPKSTPRPKNVPEG